MKLKFALLISFLLIATTITNAQSEGASDSRSFNLSSRDTGFGVEGDFTGTYYIHDDSIEVNLSKAIIYVSEHCPYQGRRSINQIKVGLGVQTGPGGRWKIESAGEAVDLGLMMKPKEEFSLYNLSFFIPKERGEDLAKRWLVIEIQTDAVDMSQEKRRRGYVYAHSGRDIFLPIDDPKGNDE